MLLRVNKFLMELLDSNRARIFGLVITPAQSRAARGLLAWSQQELAREAGVGIVTVHQLEAGTSQPRRATLDVIRRAFERAGVEFIEENGGGAGVRLRKRSSAKSPTK
jgi:transcriptional regulator with XRE-family HTH domain